MEFVPGQQLGGLSIERELGRGAYGVVYQARDALLARRVALKVLPGGDSEVERTARDQALAEARLVASLNSPYVVALYRLREGEDGGWMLEMECVDGGSLEEEIAGGKPFVRDRALGIFRGVCYALKAAHAARVIHGDIKPGNVLFDRDGNVKLTDFGLARMLEGSSSAVALHGEAFGTPAYMAPEVMSGESAGIASDIWAAGVLLYQMLTGFLPFPATNFIELWQGICEGEPTPLSPDVPDAVADLVLRCLAKDPAARPASAAALLEELDRIESEDASLVGSARVRERPTNVAPPVSSIIGRTRELDEVASLLRREGVQLLTLTGPGGIGKTTLSREVCRVLLDELEGGCWFADLSACQDAAAIARELGQALGVPAGADPDPVAQIGAVLQLRDPMLIVLDNFEQVVRAARSTVATWMAAAPNARFLVTSRALLGIAGERSYELQPLPAPSEEEETRLDPALARQFAGVQLFVERAREADSRFELTEDRVADVSRICRELDGIPLAIELAAARARIMRPAQIASKLGQRFQLLRSARTDLAPRQKTLMGAIDWSFDLLEDWERSAFLQACVFRGGFLLDAAEEVIDLSAFEDASLAMDAIQSLREKSLLIARDDGLETRLSMYGSIRDYGRRKLADELDEESIRSLQERHRDHYLAVAEEWNAQIPGTRDQEALDRLDAEAENFTAVQERAIRAGDGVTAARACLGVATMMVVRHPPRELVPLVEAVLSTLGDGQPLIRTRLDTQLARAHTLAGDWDRAVEVADEAVERAEGLGDDAVLAEALLQQGDLRRFRGRLEAALESFLRCEEVARRAGEESLRAQATGGRGSVLWQQGKPDEAARCWSEAESIARRIEDGLTLVRYGINRGVTQEARGEIPEAIASYREAEDRARRLGDRHWVAVSLSNQANARLKAGDAEAALLSYTEAESIARDIGDRSKISEIVGNRGSVHALRGELDTALECYREAESIVRQLGEQRRIAVVLAQRGKVHVRLKEFEGALACYQEAESIANDIGDRQLRASNLCRQAELRRAQGELEEAWKAVTGGIALYDGMGLVRNLNYFQAKVLQAEIADRLGRAAQASRCVEEALSLASDLGLRPDHAAPSVGHSFLTLARLSKKLEP